MRVLIAALLLGWAWTPPAVADVFGTDSGSAVSVAMVELHNLTDEALPRVGSYTENAFYKYFSRDSRLRVVGRTEVSALIIERRDRVVLFPGNSELTAGFARDLGVDYVLTGNILEYEVEENRHYMAVELVLIGAVERNRVFRKIYSGAYRDGSGYKKHREILDQIIETLAVDFASVLQGAKQRRDEALARLRAAAQQAKARRVEPAVQESTPKRIVIADSMQNTIKSSPQPGNGRHVKVEVLEIELQENTWGGIADGDAEFEFLALLPRDGGNADFYSFPPQDVVNLGLGERLMPADGGFVVTLPGDSHPVEISFVGFDSDELSPTMDIFVDALMGLLATSAKVLAKTYGMLKVGATLVGVLVELGGQGMKAYLEQRDTIGEGRIALDASIPWAPDGAIRSVTSTNGAMKIRYRVSAFPIAGRV